MLKYKVNIKNSGIKYHKLAEYGNELYSACTFVLNSGDSTVEMFLPSYVCGNIYKNDILSFYRKDGVFIEYSNEKLVKDSEIVSGDTYVHFTQFPQKILLKIEKAEKKTINGTAYVLFTFNKEHYFNSREKNVKKNISNEEEIAELCNGDYFIKDDYFIYEKVSDSEYVNVNSKCDLFWNNSLEGEKHVEGIVPCLLDGSDMKRTLMFEYFDVKDLYNNYNSFMCWIRDNRFFEYFENVLELRPGTIVRLRKGDINIGFASDNVFSPYILEEDGVKQYLEDKANGMVTEAIDYEKQQFSPVVYAENTVFFVNRITFYMHLRKRDNEWNVEPYEDWVSYRGCGPFGTRCFDEIDNVLDNNNFTEDDIYYQRKCVSETFLRLSFYDKIDRGKQKLLYTAKLYLDENRLWTEYVNQKDDDIKYIPFMFTCTNKYDYNSKTEGFYLHLFPGNIKELENGGAVFMKIELCHAKYGKTVLLTLPIYPNTVTKYNGWRGKSYWNRNGSYTNMAELNNDMYIKVRLKYDNEYKQYVWFFDGATEKNDADNLEIHLYEPKMM